MNILVGGATGMTGTPLVEQLLAKNHKVRIIFRTSNKLPADILKNPKVMQTFLCEIAFN